MISYRPTRLISPQGRANLALGKRKHEQQAAWVATTDLPMSQGHSCYRMLNQLVAQADFEEWLEALCAPCYSTDRGRESIPPDA